MRKTLRVLLGAIVAATLALGCSGAPDTSAKRMGATPQIVNPQLQYADTINGSGVALSSLTGQLGSQVYVNNGDGSGNPYVWTCAASTASVDHLTVEAVAGITGSRWLRSYQPQGGGGGSSDGGLASVATSAPVSGNGKVGTPVTIAANAIPLSDLAQGAGNTLVGNGTGSTANFTALTIVPTAAMPAFTGPVSTSAGSVATALNLAGGSVSGALPCASMSTLTGDVTNSSCATTIAASAVTTSKINAAAVTYAKMQNEGAGTLLCNSSVAPASPAECTVGSGLMLSGGVLSATGGGGGITALTGPVTASGSGSVATSVTNNAITNAMLAQMGASTVKGNNTGGTANAADLTTTQVNAMLGAFVPVAGAAIGNVTTITIAPGTDQASNYVQNVTLTGNLVVTLSTTSAATGQVACVIREGAGAFSINMTDGGSAGTTNMCNGSTGLAAPTGTKYPRCCAQYNGADWIPASVGFVTQ